MASDILFHLDKNSRESLQSQLRRAILNAILNSTLPAGFKLPSSRKLAKDLGISRNTAILVYQSLTDDGYLVAHERSGLFVNKDFVAGLEQSRLSPEKVRAPLRNQEKDPDWNSRLYLRPSDLDYLNLPKNWQHKPYPFIYGQPDRGLFPLTAWRECSRLALSTRDMADWIHDDKIYDDPQLVEQIRTRLLPARGIHVSSDQILVTLGGQNALYMLAGLLVRKNTRVAIENPGYPDAKNIMRLFTEKLTPIPVDEQGMVVDERLNDCDYAFVTPSHQCPTTVTMPLSRRCKLLEKAEEQDFIVIEDDYENEINYFKSASPSLKALDTNNRVIYISSLSKTLFPGLRVGYVVAAPELIAQLSDFRRLVVRYTPSNNQRTVALFLSHGYYDSLIYSLRKRWHRRWEAVSEALDSFLPQCSYPHSSGGTSYWVRVPEQLSADTLVKEAYNDGVLIESGRPFFLERPAPDTYIRIGFTSIETAKIEPGIKQLASTIEHLVK
ncbi:PLP-dependent aminotransferase family protein [Kiloniella laminariae]|uniref:PLP-dependent aminotransferase family protein n=1 Tax=Kiloniella laminariae TaxID=454162 RepID=A0ABT4LN01_9PROT|nr:PLP-dependent aminotransferase family protein [Kiloniella laminariae]MCZ4282489.1 PLP-dependent aminotransferase family protein [Kiloniella laminariae]